MAIIETERIGNEHGGYSVECVICGNWFEAKRYDAAFCSSTCRSRYNRQLKELDKQIERANQSIEYLIKVLPRRGESRTFAELQRMNRRIQSALATVETA